VLLWCILSSDIQWTVSLTWVYIILVLASAIPKHSIIQYWMYCQPDWNIHIMDIGSCIGYSDMFHHPILNGLSARHEHTYNGYWFLHRLLWCVPSSNINWTVSLTGTYIQLMLVPASAILTHSTVQYLMDCQPDINIHAMDIGSWIGYSNEFNYPIFNGLSAWQEYTYNEYWFLHRLLQRIQLSSIQWTVSLTWTYMQWILVLELATPTCSTIQYSMDCQPDRTIHTMDIGSCIGYSDVFHHPIFNGLSAWHEHTYNGYWFLHRLRQCIPLSNIQWATMDIL